MELDSTDDVFLQDDLGPTLAEHALQCNQIFKECIAAPKTTMDPTLLDDQLARFTLWTSNMDVFGPPNVSLDYMLRYSPTVVDIIHQLLNVVYNALKKLRRSILKPSDNQLETTTWKKRRTSGSGRAEVTQTVDYSSDIDSSGDQVERNISLITYTIGGTVSQLFRMSNAVRRASKAARAGKIAKYESDEKVNNAIGELRLYTECYVRFRFPHAAEALRSTLVEANALRFRRLCYQRAHRRRVALSGKHQQADTVTVQLPKLPFTTSAIHSPSSKLPKPRAVDESWQFTGDFPASTTHATTAQQTAVRAMYDGPMTEVLQAKSVAVNSTLSLPPPPNTSECPYCGVILAFNCTMSPILWKNHVITDLEPFVCLSAHCAELTFDTSKAWVKHMQTAHGHIWECRAPSHELVTFKHETEFQEHSRTEHAVPETYVGALSDAAQRPVFQKIVDCPFGDHFTTLERAGSSTAFASDALQQHVATHMKEIALLALQKLPSDDDHNSEEISSDILSENDGVVKLRGSMYSVLDDEALDFLQEAGDAVSKIHERGIASTVNTLHLEGKDAAGMTLHRAVRDNNSHLAKSLIGQNTHFAILIGVDFYHNNPLNSCVQDVQLIESYFDELPLDKRPNKLDRTKLTASTPLDRDQENPPEAPGSLATKQNIVDSLHAVMSKASNGDHVYLHYSGHGTTLPTGELALVPFGCEYDDNNLLNDYLASSQLSELLSKIAVKGASLLLVLDCCFAGAIRRQNQPDATRYMPFERFPLSLSGRLRSPPTYDSFFISEQSFRGVSLRANWLLDSKSYTIIAACSPTGTTHGLRISNGNVNGCLTYFLFRTLRKLDSFGMSHMAIFRFVCAMFEALGSPQVPQMKGHGDFAFFSHLQGTDDSFFPAVKLSSGKIGLRAGKLMGVDENDQVALGSLDAFTSENWDSSYMVATAREVDGFRAVLDPCNFSSDDVNGTWVARPLKFLTRAGSTTTLPPSDSSQTIELDGTCENVLVPPGFSSATAPARAIVKDRRSFELQDRNGQTIHFDGISQLSPTFANANGLVMRALEQIAQFHYILDAEPMSETEKLHLEINIALHKKSGELLTNERTIEVEHGQVLTLSVVNCSKKPVFVNIYGLMGNWDIENLLNSWNTTLSPAGTAPLDERAEVTVEMEVPESNTGRGIMFSKHLANSDVLYPYSKTNCRINYCKEMVDIFMKITSSRESMPLTVDCWHVIKRWIEAVYYLPMVSVASYTLPRIKHQVWTITPIYSWQVFAYNPNCSLSTFNQLLQSLVAAVHLDDGLPLVRITAARKVIRILGKQDMWDDARGIGFLFIELLLLVCSRHLSLVDQQQAISHTSGLAAEVCSILLKLGENEEALKQLEASRAMLLGFALDSSEELSALQGSAKHKDLLEQFTDVVEKLRIPPHLQGLHLGEVKMRERRLAETQFSKLIDEIRSMDGYRDFLSNVSVDSMKSCCKDGAIVLVNMSYIGSHAIILFDTELHLVPLPELEWEQVVDFGIQLISGFSLVDFPVQRAAKVLSRRAPKGTQAAQPDLLHWLWRFCVLPIFGKLGVCRTRTETAELQRIWWIGSGAAAGFPFHAAASASEPGEDVLSLTLSSYAPSVKVLLNSKRNSDRLRGELICFSEKKLSVTIITMETTPEGHIELPGVSKEKEVIEGIVSSKSSFTWLEQPTASRALEAMLKSNIVHVACHGVSNRGDPSQSHFVLERLSEDGNTKVIDKLTVSQLLAVKSTQNAWIAFLSACSTSTMSTFRLGDEGLHLSGALLVAGFPHVVGSLWKVEDNIAVDIAGYFYEALFSSEGLHGDSNVAAALRKAIMRVREQHPNPESWRKWAAYIHLGT